MWHLNGVAVTKQSIPNAMPSPDPAGCTIRGLGLGAYQRSGEKEKEILGIWRTATTMQC